jgi:PAS domain S-box-containing protein
MAVAAVGGLTALALLVGPAAIRNGALAAAFAALALLAALSLWLPARRVGAGVTVVALLAVGAIGVAATKMGFGSTAPGIGFIALHAAFAAAVVGLGAGVAVGGLGVAVIFGLGWAQYTGWLSPAIVAPWRAVAVHTALIACSVGGGWTAARVLSRYVREAVERKQQFQGLLRIAVDAYWELDPQFRLLTLSRSREPAGGRPAEDEGLIGTVPWEHGAFECDPETLDQLQADLGARQRFRDVPVQWHTPRGPRHLLVSGEPRFCSRGVFRGYWGVARDVTADQRARQALQLTESRFHDLFVSLPTPLVLHRGVRVIDANPAALAMFGHRDLASMVGSDLLAPLDDDEQRARALERIEALQAQPSGSVLPVSEYHLTSRTGRRLAVRSTGVTVQTGAGPGVLSIFVDDTERHLAEQAVRRSEALLSHLVASSPDVITLTDLASGRFAMVNQTFERVIGWSADEVIGRTSLEIGTWADPAERERFVGGVREHGMVQDLPVRFCHRDGHEIPMLVSGARFLMDRREYLVINARDVSEAERARLEREAILDNASIGIALTRDQRFQMVNPRFEAMLGWPDGSIIGQPGATVWPSQEAYVEIGQRIGPALSRGEQIEIECEVRRRDDSRFLCRMLARAVDPSHPLRGGTIWIVEDITERRRVDEALARARDAAEAANRAKSVFLANTSHELRTPLNGLLGLAQLARDPATTQARRSQYLDQIVDSAQSLALIVSDILDLSKIEAGKLTVEREPFDLVEMLRTMRRGYTTLAAARGVALELEVDPALGWVQGDALRVRQILTNYLSNAIKFTGEGRVRVVARREGEDDVRFEVHDTGPGIDAATRARLFQPFTQADQSTTRRYGGTGLGLSICRELALLMRGEVGVDSQPGAGSCFWARLPLPGRPEPQPEPEPDLQDPAAIEGAHVLVVDDNDVNMVVAVAQLESLGVRVGQARDGQQALDAVRSAMAAGDPYDLVLMDLQMPVLSGFEVTRALRQDKATQDLPIVAYTAAALVTEREAAFQAGMDDFLPKPTEPDRLRAMVARWAVPHRIRS